MKNFNNRYFCKNIHRYFTDISDISVKSNYRYIRVYRYFDPCLEVDKGNYKGPKALYSLYKTLVYKGLEDAVIIVRENDHL